MLPTIITSMIVKDIRFPISQDPDAASDAMHKSVNFSTPYVILETDSELEGHGSSFTLGRGNDIVCYAIKSMSQMVIGRRLEDIFGNFSSYYRELTSDEQARWIGPEKGVVHIAVAGILNALWDLWAKMEGKPLWKLLVDMDAEKLVSTIDFRYIKDVLTKEEALAMLKKMDEGKEKREKEMETKGYPAYITSCGWLGFNDEKIRRMTKDYMKQGFTSFKMKVGVDIEDDIRRAKVFRESIGYSNQWFVDANQVWEVQEAIDWMKRLAEYKPLWIEEPTSPDDILGHATIAKALNPLGISVATGEMCQNRIMFKQFLQAKALQFLQTDPCRLGGVNENLAVMLMAAKFGVPVCPHSGGSGEPELVQHLSIFDYIRCCGTLKNRMTEYVVQSHEHFLSPPVVKNGRYLPPKTPGYLVGMKKQSMEDLEFPHGKVWKKLIEEGKV